MSNQSFLVVEINFFIAYHSGKWPKSAIANIHYDCSTVCLRISNQFYVVTYYIKRVTSSWTYSNKDLF